jgi:uncharacterized membrane protein
MLRIDVPRGRSCLQRRFGQEGRDKKPRERSVHVFELEPNCSLTFRAAALLYLSILAVTLPVAVACAWAGFWPVLPFAGAEVAAFWIALQLSLRRGRLREQIRIDEREITVQRRGGRRDAVFRFARPWTRVRLVAAGVPTWPSRLLFASMGRSVEVGEFLTETERRQLGARLADLLGRGDRVPPDDQPECRS